MIANSSYYSENISGYPDFLDTLYIKEHTILVFHILNISKMIWVHSKP